MGNLRPSSSGSESVVAGRSHSAKKLLWLIIVLAVPSFGATLLGFAQIPAKNAAYDVKPIALPGAKGVVTLDYFAYDGAHGRLWVPAGNTGNVDVIDAATDVVTPIGPYATGEFQIGTKHGVLGPSSVSLGDGVVYVGNRADSTICVIDAATLKAGDCTHVAKHEEGIAAAPDGLQYVATTKELWFTRGAPPLGVESPDQSISILDATDARHLKPGGKISLGGSAEGYAVDETRGIFYTNLEEAGLTVAIDARRREVLAKWRSGCDEPHGLAIDRKRGFLFVACSARVVALDVRHDGKVLGSIDAGAGVDNIDYSEECGALYAAAADAGTLTIAAVDAQGLPKLIATVPTSKSTRSVVVGKAGTGYLIDPLGGTILKVTPKK